MPRYNTRVEIDLDRTTNWPPRPAKPPRKRLLIRQGAAALVSVLAVSVAVWQCMLWRSRDDVTARPLTAHNAVVESVSAPIRPAARLTPGPARRPEKIAPPA